MFRAAMCTSSGELLYQCDSWFMSLLSSAWRSAAYMFMIISKWILPTLQPTWQQVRSHLEVILNVYAVDLQALLKSDINQVSHWYNNSHDDGHMAARNMYRIEINIHEKLCVKLVTYKELYLVHKSTVWKKEETAKVKPGSQFSYHWALMW